MQTLPERPTPAKKKPGIWSVVGAILGGLLILAAIGKLGGAVVDEPAPVPAYGVDEVSVDEPAGFEVTADLVVDTMGPEGIAQFCTYYAQLGDSAAYAAFASGYGAAQDPDAGEVFDELVSRC